MAVFKASQARLGTLDDALLNVTILPAVLQQRRVLQRVCWMRTSESQYRKQRRRGVVAPRKKVARLQGNGSSRLPSVAAVELYVKALDVPTDCSEQEPWSTYFRLAAADTAFGDGTGSPSSGGVGGGGLRGASLAPDENVAASHLPGGQPALEPQVERSRAVRRKQREATKQRRAAAVQELQQLRAWKQATEGSPSKVTNMGNDDKKGKSNLHSKTRDGKEFYDSGDDKQGMCADVAPSKPCSSGRADVMRISVEYNRFEHAIYLWNAREVEARVVLRLEAFQTNLYSHVQSMNGLAPETTVAPCTEQLFRGLADVHHGGFAHRDIKLENISLSSGGQFKIAGFGWCGRIEVNPTSLAGTGQPLASEMLEERPQAVAVVVNDGYVGSHCGETRTFSTVHRRSIQRPTHLSPGCWASFSICGLVSRIGSLFLKHSSIGGCRLLRWLHHCCHPVCLMISCSPLALLGEGTFTKIFGVAEKAIVKDLVVEKMDRILYTNLGVDISFRVLDGLKRRGEEVLEVADVRTLRPVARWVVKGNTHLCVLVGGEGSESQALSISRVRPRALLARRQ